MNASRQALMELRATTRAIATKADRLATAIKSRGEGISALQSQSTFIKGWIAGVGVVVTIVVAVTGFLLRLTPFWSPSRLFRSTKPSGRSKNPALGRVG